MKHKEETYLYVTYIFLFSICDDVLFENEACCMVYDSYKGSIRRILPGKTDTILDQNDSYRLTKGDKLTLKVVKQKSFEVRTIPSRIKSKVWN